jgi:hypothetical protein
MRSVQVGGALVELGFQVADLAGEVRNVSGRVLGGVREALLVAACLASSEACLACSDARFLVLETTHERLRVRLDLSERALELAELLMKPLAKRTRLIRRCRTALGSRDRDDWNVVASGSCAMVLTTSGRELAKSIGISVSVRPRVTRRRSAISSPASRNSVSTASRSKSRCVRSSRPVSV